MSNLTPVETAVKQANTKLLKVTADARGGTTWDEVMGAMTGDEYQAYLAGYLMALDLYAIHMDLTKEAHSWNI